MWAPIREQGLIASRPPSDDARPVLVRPAASSQTLGPSFHSFLSLMSARYAPLPNPHTDPDAIDEMEAAFDDSDDEEDHHPRQPITSRNGYHSLPNAEPPAAHDLDRDGPTAYDFERDDYDYTRPPPGSPPGPSARALPNEFGNSNGLVPSFADVSTTDAAPRRGGGWLRRTATSVLPSHYVQRLGLGGGPSSSSSGPVGGGTGNDGVFANVTAKPGRQVRIQDGASSAGGRRPLPSARPSSPKSKRLTCSPGNCDA